MSPGAGQAPGLPRSVLADTVLERLTLLYPTAADPVRARSAAAYMKHVAPFLGIPTPRRRALSRSVLAGTARPAEPDCAAIALRCWALPEREYQYFAIDYLRRHVAHCSSGFVPVLRRLVTTVPWWDTVDVLAAHVAGPLVAADPELRRTMDEWIEDDDLWIVRTALLHQLRFKEATDARQAPRLLPAPRGPSRLLHPQGDRLGPARVRQDRPGGRTGLRRQCPGPAGAAVRA